MSTLEFRLRDMHGDAGEALRTTCELAVYLDDVAIWPVRNDEGSALEVQVDDLLSHLVEFWKPLVLRQTYPLMLNPPRPAFLRMEAQKRWSEAPEAQAILEDEILEGFQDAHDLSRCFAGTFDLPPLWFLRSGNEVLIDTGQVAALDQVPFGAALDGLSRVGDDIAERLHALNDDRWADLLAAWRKRQEGDRLTLLAWTTSLDRETARALAADGLLTEPYDVTDAATDDDELRLAARMASALPSEQVRAVLARVLAFPKQPAPDLDRLAARVRTYVMKELRNRRPYEQGEAMARFLRETCRIASDAEVDVFGLVKNLGIRVEEGAIDPDTLDGLAVWGPRHGPAILINRRSRRHAGATEIAQIGGVRVTLAHELCHFLMDAEHAVSAVDVLNNRMPYLVEQRARAFAAEFLLPSSAAMAMWTEANRPRDRAGLMRVLNRLCRRYRVTKSVAAWKLEHGAIREDIRLGAMLTFIVPQR